MHIRFLILLMFASLMVKAQSFEIYSGEQAVVVDGITINKGDTINIKDAANKKQGVWITENASTGKKITDGRYLNNKKVGVWNKYYDNGKLKSSITYVAGKPDGFAQVYYENGNLAEEGIWKGDKWVGDYKYYYENGNPCYQWAYNEKGERTGKQLYYHENGNVKIEGDWKEGKEQGVVKEYHENGALKAEKVFEDGKMDATQVKTFPKKETKVVEKEKEESKENNANNENNSGQTEKHKQGGNMETFSGNGFHRLFHPVHRKIQKEGEFVNGQLHTGKHYVYDEDGTLIRMLEYENGKRINDIKYEKKEE